METLRPTVTGPDEQGAYDIQNGAETFCMYPCGRDLIFEQHDFTSFRDACTAIAEIVTKLQATSLGNNACYLELGLGASIRLNAFMSSVQINFSPSPGSNGIPPLALRKLIEIRVLLASLVSE